MIKKKANIKKEFFDLSFSQQQLWLTTKLKGNKDTSYNQALAVKLIGRLNLTALKKSLLLITQRHEALRSTFHLKREKIKQNINAIDNIDISIDNIAKEDMMSILEEEASRTFELSSGPLVRYKILKINQHFHTLLITMYHIVTDPLSMKIFAQELSTLYTNYIQQKNSLLPPLQYQYRDFIRWQNIYLNSTTTSQQSNYWITQLDNVPTCITLPLDYSRPAKLEYKGKRYKFKIPKLLTKSLQSFSKEKNTAITVMMLSTFTLLLARYSHQQDICVGHPISTRYNKNFENIIGFFTNILPLRVKIDNTLTFIQYLKSVEAILLKAYKHQDIPFSRLIEMLKPDRSASHSPIFQILFLIQDTFEQHLKLPEITATSIAIETYSTKYDLSLVLIDSTAGIQKGYIEYNTGLFKHSTIKHMVNHYITLLENSIGNTTSNLNQLAMLNYQEQKQLTFTANNTKIPHSDNQCIHTLIENADKRHPHRIAIIYKDQYVSYNILNKKSNQLSHYLIKMGAQTESRIGFIITRSTEMIISILAILKTGACYLPIDITYPTQRTVYQINNSNIKILLTNCQLSISIKKINGLKIINLNKDKKEIERSPKENPSVFVSPLNIAYINYTSGTTGKPKGISITHKAVKHLVFNKKLPITEHCTLLQLASISFDASTFEIWGSLLNAGTCVLYPENTPTLHTIENILNEQNISLLWLTSALFNFIVEENIYAIKTVKIILTGGEVISKKHINQATQMLPNTLFFNCYGPTENTTFTSYYKIEKKYNSTKEKIPIGQAINNTSTYILDCNLEPVSIGLIGQLYIGGDGLARGYIVNSSLTAEKFIPHPFSTTGGSRLYKTGDLARWSKDMQIEFVGRFDKQVKIRGYRIELNEIEHTLIQLPEVIAAAVNTKEKKQNSLKKYIIAYIVAKDKHTTTNTLESNIRNKLKKILPDYMIPNILFFVDSIAITQSGKKDYQSLPNPEIAKNKKHDKGKPKTEIEKILCHIWKEVLQVKEVNIYDNFFSLGGDSILSLQIISQARTAGIEINTHLIFNSKNIENLAKNVSFKKKNFSQHMVTGHTKLLPIQKWFFSINHYDINHFNQYCLLSIPENFNAGFLYEVISKLYQKHDTLRLRFYKKTNRWRAEFKPFNQTMINKTILEYILPIPKDKQLTCLQQLGEKAQQSLNIEQGSLFKAVYFKSKKNTNSRLLLIIHHLIIDSVSWRILLQDLSLAYKQRQLSKKIVLTKKTSNFKQWAEALHQNIKIEESEIKYWKQQLSASNKKLVVKKNTNNIIKSVELIIDIKTTKKIITQCQHHYKARINELLLSALAIAVEKWRGINSLHLILEGHGRENLFEDIDIGETLGWFTSIFPKNLFWEKNMPIEETIKTIKAQLRTIPRNGIGYGLLRYISNNQEIKLLEKTHTPEIVFNYLGQFDQQSGEKELFSRKFEPVGNRFNKNQHNHKLKFTGEIIQQSLRFNLDYNLKEFDHEDIKKLTNEIYNALDSITKNNNKKNITTHSIIDFPLAEISQKKFDYLKTKYPTLEDIYPISNMQLGMLYHSHKNYFIDNKKALSIAADENYTTQFHISHVGKINTQLLKTAWEKVLLRHSILRTAFIDITEKKPQQIVVKSVKINWQERNWSEKTEKQFISDFKIQKNDEKRKTFDLLKPGIMRFSIFKKANHNIEFLWTHHHSLLDGWSIPIILKELNTIYYSLKNHTTLLLPPVTPYRHYIQWLQQQDKNQAIGFWKEELKGIKQATAISFTATQYSKHNNTEEESLILSISTTKKLLNIIKKYQITLNTALLGAWAYLLHCYTGDTDIIFGETLSGRNCTIKNANNIVGLFITTIPLRIKVDTKKTLSQWLQEIHLTHNQCEHYSYLSLPEIQRCTLILPGKKLFNSLIAFQIPLSISNDNKENLLNITNIHCNEQTHYDITLTITPKLDKKFSSIRIQLKYSNKKYTKQYATNILKNISSILEAIFFEKNTYVENLSELNIERFSKNTIGKRIIEKNNVNLYDEKLGKQISLIWSEILDTKKEKFDIDDNFFSLGGDSIYAMKLIKRLHDCYIVDISIEDIFKNPTLHDLTKYIKNKIIKNNVFSKSENFNKKLEEKGVL